MRGSERSRGGTSGQASIELVASLPLLVLMVTAVWQATVASRSFALARSAASRAARAEAIGRDPRSPATIGLPSAEARRAKLSRVGDGRVRVDLAVPHVLGDRVLGRSTATARFEGQVR